MSEEIKEIIKVKAGIVEDIANKLSHAQSAVLIDYRGLTVAEVTELRNQFRAQNVEYRVLKNTLISRALEQLGIEGAEEYLNGPTAVAFGMEDAVAPAKVISEFIKKTNKTQIKAGILSGKVVSAQEIEALAKLPSREVLLAMVMGTMNAPLTHFVGACAAIPKKLLYALNAIAEKKSA